MSVAPRDPCAELAVPGICVRFGPVRLGSPAGTPSTPSILRSRCGPGSRSLSQQDSAGRVIWSG
jgi:hypothetical protein